MNTNGKSPVFEAAFAMWPALAAECYYLSRGVRQGQEFVATGETEPYSSRDVAMIAAQQLLREGVPGYMVECDAGRLRIIEPCLPKKQDLQRYLVVSFTHEDDCALEVVDAPSREEAVERIEALGRALGGGHVHECKSLDEWAGELAEMRSKSAPETEAYFHHFERRAYGAALTKDLAGLRAGFEMLALAPAAQTLDR